LIRLEDPVTILARQLGPVHGLVGLPQQLGGGKLLIARRGFEPERIRMLTDADATRARILEELDALIQRVGKRDRVLIYYSGHGASAQAGNA
jgi:hypothetical protein